MNLEAIDAQRLVDLGSRLGRTPVLTIAGGVVAAALALVVWTQGQAGFVWSLFVGVGVVLFAATFGLGCTAVVLTLRHQETQASRWSLRSLWFLLAGIGVVVIGTILT